MDWTSKAEKMGLSVDQVKRDLITSYLESFGGVMEFNPGSTGKQNIMKSLELWIVGECRSVQKSTHRATTCQIVVGFLTEKGVIEAQKLFDQSNDQELKSRLESRLHDFPLRVVQFLVSVLKEYKVLNDTTFSNLESKHFNYPYFLRSGRQFSVLPISFTQEMANILSQLGLGAMNCPTHTTKGWGNQDLLRVPPETAKLMESVAPGEIDLPTMLGSLREHIRGDIATLELIQVITSKGQLTVSDLEAMDIWHGKKTFLLDQLEDFNRKGLTTKPPTDDIPTVLVKDLNEVRNQVLEKIKIKSIKWWKEPSSQIGFITVTDEQSRIKSYEKTQKEVIIGSERETAQWGVIGKSGNRLAKFDLNAPHIVFICGKMGSGKGYTIGVLCEMLASESIPGLSNISKKATIIVLYSPREDKKSEFWSIPFSNDVDKEVRKLRDEYNVGPQQLVSNERLRVFVDPWIYEKAASDFKKDYATENVQPLHVDPSSLEAEEWATVLSVGQTKDKLYVKRLFAIIEALRFEPFDLDTVRRRVFSDDKLNQSQKNFADQRLELLRNYLTGAKEQDFVTNLALGGVNIIDLRKIIRAPDDRFSIMTLILSVLQTKKGLEDEPFVFVVNEAHDYFRKGISKEFVENIEYMIRRKRFGANWLLLDTHFPDDVDDKVIKLADVKIVHFLDKTVESKILRRVFNGDTAKFSALEIGQAFISADSSSEGRFKPLLVNIRPRLTKHGAPTKMAVNE